uniref:Uncharacterized protein n=1 Tax=Salix viminalis TaxID=40686 RepID=A0A6N2M517_SALVM
MDTGQLGCNHILSLGTLLKVLLTTYSILIQELLTNLSPGPSLGVPYVGYARSNHWTESIRSSNPSSKCTCSGFKCSL